MALDRYYPLSKQPVLRGLDAYAASWMVASPSRAASLPVHISRGVQSYLYANRVGFFVGKLELLLVPALAYLLLRAPVEERYRAHSLLDLTDLQLGPIQACLLAHQLSDTLTLLFLAQVSRDRLLVCLATEHPTSPRAALYGLRGAWGIGVGMTPTLLLDRLRLHLLLPLFLPDLLQQLPPRISDSEHRAVNVIVIRKFLPFTSLVLGLLLTLQHIVVD